MGSETLAVAVGISWIDIKLDGWFTQRGTIVSICITPQHKGQRNGSVCSRRGLMRDPLFTRVREEGKIFYPTRSCVGNSLLFACKQKCVFHKVKEGKASEELIKKDDQILKSQIFIYFFFFRFFMI